MALLGGRRRTADVMAGERGAVVMRIDRHCMDILFRDHPDLLEEFEHIRDVRKEELPPETSLPRTKPLPPLRSALRYSARFLWPW